MVHYAVVFFVLAVVFALFGQSGIAGTASIYLWISGAVSVVLGVALLLRHRGNM